MTRLVASMYLQSLTEIKKKKKKRNASPPSVIATRNQASDRARRDFVDKVGTAKNVIMWTRQQYRLVVKHIVMSI